MGYASLAKVGHFAIRFPPSLSPGLLIVPLGHLGGFGSGEGRFAQQQLSRQRCLQRCLGWEDGGGCVDRNEDRRVLPGSCGGRLLGQAKFVGQVNEALQELSHLHDERRRRRRKHTVRKKSPLFTPLEGSSNLEGVRQKVAGVRLIPATYSVADDDPNAIVVEEGPEGVLVGGVVPNVKRNNFLIRKIK